MDDKKEKIINDEMKSLMEFIDEDANPPVQQKPNWLCGKCMSKKRSTENSETHSLPTGSNNSDECKKDEDSSKCVKMINKNNKVSKKIDCEYCGQELWKQNLKKHIERCHNNLPRGISSERFHQGSCIDNANGIFLVSETLAGIQFPVHVQKFVAPGKTPVLFCESKHCQKKSTACGVSGIVNFTCDHLMSIPYMSNNEPAVDLSNDVLDELVTSGRISRETKDACISLKKNSQSWGNVLVNKMNVDKQFSDRFIFLSVWTGETHYYSRLARVVVRFDREKMDMNCKCNDDVKVRCIHKSVAKWFLFSQFPEVFDGSGDLSGEQIVSNVGFHVNPPTKKVFQPKDCINIDDINLVESFDSNQIMVPKENYCQEEKCCFVKLELVEEKKKEPKLFTRHGIIRILRVWKKVCPNCQTEYWCNDVKDGVFNYDNQLFFSIELLKWIGNALYLNIAISKEVTLLNLQYDISLDPKILRSCFYKFIVLSSFDYSCLLCGHHPVIMTFDVNRKCAFRMKETDVDIPSSDYVDYNQFWETIKSLIMGECLGDTKHVSNTPSGEFWAPHILEEGRAEKVMNTEYLKGKKDDVEQKYLENLDEENLEELLIDADLKTLRGICQESGIDASNSTRVGCIKKLKDALKERIKIDKFFFKIRYASGGLLCATCPHGIVYGFKCLLKAESPRDVADILLSLKHPPNIVISDMPHILAAHMNKRVPNFFNPYSGRVIAPTDENVLKAEMNQLPPQDIFWLNRMNEKAIPDVKTNGTNIHPITLVHQRLSLFDKFHERNTKQKKEITRQTKFVKQLEGVVTETAEQLNSYLSRSLYFLTCLSPIHHLIMIKYLLSIRNKHLNRGIMKDLGITKAHTFDIFGRIILQQHTSGVVPKCESTKSKLPVETLTEEHSDASRNIVDSFPDETQIEEVHPDELHNDVESLPDVGLFIGENVINDNGSPVITINDLIQEEKKPMLSLPSLKLVEPPNEMTGETSAEEDSDSNVEPDDGNVSVRKENITNFLCRNISHLKKIVLDETNVGKKFTRDSLFAFCYDDVEIDVIQEFLKEKHHEFQLDQSDKYDVFAKSIQIMTLYNNCKGEDIKESFGGKKKKAKLDLPVGHMKNLVKDLKNILQLMVRNNFDKIRSAELKYKGILKNIMDNISLTNYDCSEIDELGSSLIPKDVEDFYGKTPYALKTSGDGNCLFNALSVLLNGNEDYASLLRLLTAIELYTYPDFYVSHPEISKAAKSLKVDSARIFPETVSRDGQEEFYTKEDKGGAVLAEAKRVGKNHSECSLITMMALSSVVGFPIYSLYPEVNYIYRTLFHRKIKPRISFSCHVDCAYILWSRVIMDERAGTWYIPNHFVPVVFKN